MDLSSEMPGQVASRARSRGFAAISLLAVSAADWIDCPVRVAMMAETEGHEDQDGDEFPFDNAWNKVTDDLSVGGELGAGQHFDGLNCSQSVKSETCSVVESSPSIKQYGKGAEII